MDTRFALIARKYSLTLDVHERGGGRFNVINLHVGDMYIGGNLNTMLAAFDRCSCDAIDPAVDLIYCGPLLGGNNVSNCGTVMSSKVISISFALVEADHSPGYLERQCPGNRSWASRV